jgi:hypothetical protein
VIKSVLFDGRQSPSAVRVTKADLADTRGAIAYVGIKVGVDVDAIHPQLCVTVILDETQARSLLVQLQEVFGKAGR